MSYSPHLPAQVYRLADTIKAAFGRFWGKLADKTEELRYRVQFSIDKLTGGLTPEKRRVALFAIAGVLVVLVLAVAVPLSAKKQPEAQGAVAVRGMASGAAPAQPGLIPPEEMFLPDEPDFVPGVMLERDRRAAWTADDAAPLWQDPLKNGEEPWRNRIEKAIDEILESVP